jgi:hypothetical protein
MKITLSVLALFVSLQPFAAAQNVSKVDAFAGFSILNYDAVLGTQRDSAYGGQGSVTFNATRWLGLTADFGGQYKNYTQLSSNGVIIIPSSVDAKSYEFLFGPQVAYRTSRVTFFTHALFGGLRQVVSSSVSSPSGSVDVSVSDTGFLMGFGGGMDINAGRHFAIRLVQFDWLPDHNNGAWSTDAIRLGFGVVVK